MIDLKTDLSLRDAFRFPLQNADARRDLAIGALWLLVPFIGWLMNMGHRIMMVHRMQNGIHPWPAWDRLGGLLRHGFITWLGMLYYYSPAILLALLARRLDAPLLWIPALLLFLLATVAIPGYMSHYSRTLDAREIFDPFRALRRAVEGGAGYWHAWGIALAALGLSFLGLLGFGIGFLLTSVWFWQVAGYGFANVFTRRYGLAGERP